MSKKTQEENEIIEWESLIGEEPENKEPEKRKTTWKDRVFRIGVTLCILVGMYLTIVYSSIPVIAKWRTIYIETAMTTNSHQWLATMFFPKSVIDKVMAERLSHVEKAVIPGFYGSDFEGNVKTFSRGGSDITGSIVAKAVHADMYENWTDVSGFLIADPRIIKNPKPIDVITYRELRELSYMGATVLHEDAIFPVRKEGIPINIRNTNAPEDKGTLIVEDTCRKPRFTITGIAGKKDFASITIEKAMMNSEVGFCRKVLEVFENNNVSIEHMPSGIDTMTIFVHRDEFEEKEQDVIAGIHRAVEPDFLELESDLALIAVVGRGMRATRGTSGRIFAALAHANVNVKMIDQGSSELNIIIGVRSHDFDAAINAIYDIFVKTMI